MEQRDERMHNLSTGEPIHETEDVGQDHLSTLAGLLHAQLHFVAGPLVATLQDVVPKGLERRVGVQACPKIIGCCNISSNIDSSTMYQNEVQHAMQTCDTTL